MVFGGSLPLAMAGAVLWGLGGALGFPVGMSAASDDPGHAAGRLSVVTSLGYTAFLAGPPLVGLLGNHVGTLDSLLAVAAIASVGMLVSSVVNPPRGTRRGDVPSRRRAARPRPCAPTPRRPGSRRAPAVASSGVPDLRLARRSERRSRSTRTPRAMRRRARRRTPASRSCRGCGTCRRRDDAEVRERVLDVEEALGADDRHALVDVERRASPACTRRSRASPSRRRRSGTSSGRCRGT